MTLLDAALEIELLDSMGWVWDVATEGTRRARAKGQAVVMLFNGTALVIYPSTTPTEVVTAYNTLRGYGGPAFVATTKNKQVIS